MRKMLLLLLGFMPFLFGRLLNWAMMTVFIDITLPYFFIGVITMAIWFLFSYFFCNATNTHTQAVVLLNLPAAFVLILVGIQELVLHSYWMNPVGMWTQMFYLPLLNIGFRLTRGLESMFSAQCACFILMIAVSYFGCYVRKKRDYAK